MWINRRLVDRFPLQKLLLFFFSIYGELVDNLPAVFISQGGKVSMLRYDRFYKLSRPRLSMFPGSAGNTL